MSTVGDRFGENATEIASMLVLGFGFLALFSGFDFFWMIWVIGFTVLVPIVAILFEDHETKSNSEPESAWDTLETSIEEAGTVLDGVFGDGNRQRRKRSERDKSTTDALATLRERYARGDLTDEQFERKLDTLLETEHPESAAEWRAREHERVRRKRERT